MFSRTGDFIMQDVKTESLQATIKQAKKKTVFWFLLTVTSNSI